MTAVTRDMLTDEADLRRRAEDIGLKPELYRCECERCMQTSQLCTAAFSQLAMDVDADWCVDEVPVFEPPEEPKP